MAGEREVISWMELFLITVVILITIALLLYFFAGINVLRIHETISIDSFNLGFLLKLPKISSNKTVVMLILVVLSGRAFVKSLF